MTEAMQIEKLDHVNLRTQAVEEMIDWYCDVLSLTQGVRPDFPFPGAWLYAGNSAVVHLVGVSSDPGAGAESTLKLEHFAFKASGEDQFKARIESLGLTYSRSELHDFNIVQYNLWDPDGNHIHVDFAADGT